MLLDIRGAITQETLNKLLDEEARDFFTRLFESIFLLTLPGPYLDLVNQKGLQTLLR